MTKKPEMIKVTLYLPKRTVLALERYRMKQIQAGVRPGDINKSEIMRQALDEFFRTQKA